jgi:FG-GAP-like repeat
MAFVARPQTLGEQHDRSARIPSARLWSPEVHLTASRAGAEMWFAEASNGGGFMSLLPLLATNIPRRTSQFLPKYAVVTIFALFLPWSPVGRASVTDQFIRLTTYPSGGTPAKIVTADFNRDGKADVVALNTNNVLSILLGTGNGGFAAPKTIATLPANAAGFPTLMVAGDFNGDGNPDVW